MLLLSQLFRFSDRPIYAGSWVSHTTPVSASRQRGRAARRDRPRPATRSAVALSSATR